MTKQLLILFFALTSLSVFGQGGESSDFSDAEDNRRFWQLGLPDGHYMIALDKIANISRHQYLLGGNLIVTEVTIDSVGNSLCRIYQITPAAEEAGSSTIQKVGQRVRDVTDRVGEITGSDFSNMVQKTYPDTTHAKTVEYRVQNRSTLDALYDSLRKAWVDGKGRKFNITK